MPPLTSTIQSAQTPYQVEPGSKIRLQFTLRPEDASHLLSGITLTFETKSDPFVPPPTPPPYIAQAGQPEYGSGSAQAINSSLQESFAMQTEELRREWEAQHPQRWFNVSAAHTLGDQECEHIFEGEVPYPKAPASDTLVDQGFTLYKGVYHLQPITLYSQPIESVITTLSAEAAEAIANYVVEIVRDYPAPPRPGPKVETIDDLHISKPQPPSER